MDIEKIKLSVTEFGLNVHHKVVSKYPDVFLWECYKCGHIWEARLCNIKRSIKSGFNGCRKCAKHVPHTLESVKETVKDRLNVISNHYKDSHTIMKWLCNIDGNVFETDFATVKCGMKGNTYGCSVCAKRKMGAYQKLTTEYVASKIPKDVKLIYYSGFATKEKSIFSCNKCKLVFSAVAGSAMRGHGCPICPQKTEAVVKKVLTYLYPDFALLYHHRICSSVRRQADFILNAKYDHHQNLWIEYDGKQHFEAVPKWGGEKALEKQHEIDANDTILAKKLNYRLFRFSYTDFDYQTPIDEINKIIATRIGV